MSVGPLFVDTFSGAGTPNWEAYAKLGPPWHGAIIKATQGTYFAPQWFVDNWKRVREAGGSRYGVDWFRGAYCFLDFGIDGKAQADFYLAHLKKAGGFAHGDFWPIIDVESGGTNAKYTPTAQQVIDVTTAWANRVSSETGREVMLYGNGTMRDLDIKSRMGCSWLWCPRWTAELPREIYERAGWTTSKLALWQYAGDGVGGDNVGLKGYPAVPPNFGTKCDASVLTIPGGLPALRMLLNGPSLQTTAIIAAIVFGLSLFWR